jgi:hydroxymethylbilane synthase
LKKSINIISRSSILAKIQANMVGETIKNSHPNINIEYITSKTSGDLDQNLDISGGTTVGVFTSDISKKVEESDNSIAVHSWKDFPIVENNTTGIYGTLKRADMRDILILKHSVKVQKNIDQLTIMTSSPRRRYAIEKNLKDLIPLTFDKVYFKDIRGNIHTRINKFLKDNTHGIVIAKAAIDRILNNNNHKSDKNVLIKECLKKHQCVILPLSIFPSAPAQGAIGIEVANKNKHLIKIVESINDIETFENVNLERQIMSEYGGGCSQKIGVSIWNKNNSKIKSINGITEEHKKLETFDLIETVQRNTTTRISNAFPIGESEQTIFRREESNKNSELNAIQDSLIYITRKNVLKHRPDFQNSCKLITSGVKTWKEAAKKGYWISGTSDSLGQAEITSMKSLFDVKNIIKLTFKNEFTTNPNSIDLYELKEPNFPKDIEERDNFFWMSPYAFKIAIKLYPSILNKHHSCGMGNTFEQIKEIIKNEGYLTPYLSYEHWLNKVEKSK